MSSALTLILEESSLNINQIIHLYRLVFCSRKLQLKLTVNICGSGQRRQRKHQRIGALHASNTTASPLDLLRDEHTKKNPYCGSQEEGGSLAEVQGCLWNKEKCIWVSSQPGGAKRHKTESSLGPVIKDKLLPNESKILNLWGKREVSELILCLGKLLSVFLDEPTHIWLP